MALDLALLKEHPYATGGIVIVGGLVVFYLLSSSSGPAAAPAASPGGMSSADYQAALAASTQNAQVQAAAQVQSNAQQVALQQQQLQADVANNQTAASLHMNDVNTSAQLAATLAQISASVQENQVTAATNLEATKAQLAAQTADTANQYIYSENLQSMQDAVLESQINSSVLENANNNATALAGLESSNALQGHIADLTAQTSNVLAGYQATVALHGVDAATALQSQQLTEQSTIESNIENYVQTTGLANTPNKDNLNAATALLQQILAGGNPSVAIANQQSTASQAATSAAATSSIISSITGAVTSIATAGMNGLFKPSSPATTLKAA
jgi:hypothetical protein